VRKIDGRFTKQVRVYRGENAIGKFLELLKTETNYCQNILKKELAHHNISWKKLRIPIFFHNLRGYNGHIIMQEIGKFTKENPITKKAKWVFKGMTDAGKKIWERKPGINVIPLNTEKYIAFTLGKHLIFLDSLQFLNQSLDKLAASLAVDDMMNTREIYDGEKFNLVKKKGVYPYDYMASFVKFKQRRLPDKDQFYSQLNNECITDAQYQYAQRVWDIFQMKNMGNYHGLYLKTDVLLLADVFENFRKTCLEYYKLDPAHYFTSPALAWDAMLKMTEVELELLFDVNMFQFIEKGIRGGTSYIAHRFSEANNKYIKSYDKTKPSKYITYLDANNLYGCAMAQYLPTGRFRWMTDKRISKLDLSKYTDVSKTGLILEVDLVYHHELHDLYNDFPFAPEQVKVTEDMLPDYCERIKDKFNISIGQVHKLIPTLFDKK